MITIVMIILITALFSGPASALSFLAFAGCCLPFAGDFALSVGDTYRRVTTGRSASDIQVTAENEESFFQADSQRRVTFIEPSQRLLPAGIANNEPVHNLLTRDWKENQIDSSNPTLSQISAFLVIAGMMYLGGTCLADEESRAAGAIAVTSAGSSLLGYMGTGDAPVMRLVRTNMVSTICALFCIILIATMGMSMPVLALLLLCGYDTYQGATASSPTWNANRGDF